MGDGLNYRENLNVLDTSLNFIVQNLQLKYLIDQNPFSLISFLLILKLHLKKRFKDGILNMLKIFLAIKAIEPLNFPIPQFNFIELTSSL